MSKNKYDITWKENGPEIVHHFCREYGCYGTNEDHGSTWHEVCMELCSYYFDLSGEWYDKADKEPEDE